MREGRTFVETINPQEILHRNFQVFHEEGEVVLETGTEHDNIETVTCSVNKVETSILVLHQRGDLEHDH